MNMARWDRTASKRTKGFGHMGHAIGLHFPAHLIESIFSPGETYSDLPGGGGGAAFDFRLLLCTPALF